MSEHLRPTLEPAHSEGHLVCWKSVAGGIFVSFAAFFILLALGLGIFGSLAQSAIEHEQNGGILMSGTGLWIGISVALSLFLGSYFASRISSVLTSRAGAAHGFVVGSFVLIVMIVELAGATTSLTRGLGLFVKGASSGTSTILSNPSVQDSIDRVLGDHHLKSDPKEVAQNLGVRLMDGDVQSAREYLMYQTGMTDQEVNAKVSQLRTEMESSLKIAGEKASRAASETGWAFFVVMIVGLTAALLGGRLGAHANNDRPIRAHDEQTYGEGLRSHMLATQRGSVLPYLLGWMLGVPASILILIALLRTVF